MAITLRSHREIELMRKAGAVVADVLLKLKEIAEPGMTTAWLDSVALQMTADAGAEALFKGVRSPVARIPFPGAICASINEQVVHGIPSEDTKLKNGDILSIDSVPDLTVIVEMRQLRLPLVRFPRIDAN